jgi:hypothetical protein
MFLSLPLKQRKLSVWRISLICPDQIQIQNFFIFKKIIYKADYMDYIKEIELEILTWLNETGKLFEDEIEQHFGDRWLPCSPVFFELFARADLTRSYVTIEGKRRYTYELSSYGLLKLAALKKQKSDDHNASILQNNAVKESRGLNRWTVLGVIIALLTLLSAVYVIVAPYFHSKSDQTKTGSTSLAKKDSAAKSDSLFSPNGK